MSQTQRISIDEARALRDKAMAKAEAIYQRRIAELSNGPQPDKIALLRKKQAERRAQALQMKRDGKTFQEIAHALAISRGRACTIVFRAIRDEIKKTIPSGDYYDVRRTAESEYRKLVKTKQATI